MIHRHVAIGLVVMLTGCMAEVDGENDPDSDEEVIDSAELGLMVNLPAATVPFYIPPHVGGDKEFKGHGPKINTLVNIYRANGNQLWVSVNMDAIETKSDWTHAQGTLTWPLYTSNQKITSILGPTTFQHQYVDNDHGVDNFSFGQGNLVKSLSYIGDVYGKDAGIATGVQVVLNPITLVTN
ncbi:MAG TPA: hypothetical protein VE093_18245 [Polyangiaceae bacterium]|jgi:hypothetical protein|nr:hypothetical protein [Polyangiaceae bacterium]